MPLSNVALPKIDQYAAKRVLANRIMNNVIQSLIYRNGLGITEEFSDDVMAAQIRIVRQKMPTQTSRTLGTGSGYNDDHFNVLDPEQPITQEYSLPLLELFDRNFDVPDVLDDMIQIGTLNITVDTLEKQLTRLINAYTMAHKIGAAFNYNYEQTKDDKPETLIRWTKGSEALLPKLAYAHAKLDDGAPSHGIDTFPQENRIVLTNTDAKYQLITIENAVYNVGSSRAVELLEIGSAGKLARAPETNVTGFFGELYNTPQHLASKKLWELAESYLGLPSGALNEVYAIVSASQATGRGVAFQNSLKIIDNPRGQGVRLQPKTRWGVEVFIPEGIRLIVGAGFVCPSVNDDFQMEVKGKDSFENGTRPTLDNSIYIITGDVHSPTFTVDSDLDGDGTIVSLGTQTLIKGTAGYDNYRHNIELIEAPSGSTIEVRFEDKNGVDVLDQGWIGIEAGAAITNEGVAAANPSNFAIRANTAGTYTAKVEMVDVGDSNKVLSLRTFTIKVVPAA